MIDTLTLHAKEVLLIRKFKPIGEEPLRELRAIGESSTNLSERVERIGEIYKVGGNAKTKKKCVNHSEWLTTLGGFLQFFCENTPVALLPVGRFLQNNLQRTPPTAILAIGSGGLGMLLVPRPIFFAHPGRPSWARTCQVGSAGGPPTLLPTL